MIRRDFLQAEIEKIAQALARIMGLKTALQNQEADDLIDKTLEQSFNLDLDEISKSNSEQLKQLLLTKKFSAQKLDLLSKFLLESVSPFQQKPETITILNHVLTIYQLLEQDYHTQSLENLNQQKIILKFLQT